MASDDNGGFKGDKRWWSAHTAGSSWHGVFQGGGAKGVAYVAALRGMAANNQWFCSAAGSSAGAITAALVAAGFHPDELAEMTGDLLGTVRPDTVIDAALNRIPVVNLLTRYSLTGLESALDERLRAGVARHGGDGSQTVTFSEITRATGIGLHVLALDATLGRPMPFCAERTPDLSVASAVAASCSIPLVFGSRFVQVVGKPFSDSIPPYRRLVDGGAWANFPAFIFTDEAFRKYFDLPAMPADAKVMGFLLSEVIPPWPSSPVRFTADPHDHMRSDVADLITSRPGRRTTGEDDDDLLDKAKEVSAILAKATPAVLAVGVTLTLLLALGVIVVDAVASQRWGVAALGAFALLIALFVTFVGRRLSRSLTREGFGTFRSLVGLATAPPNWATLDRRTSIVWVPPGDVDTTDFRLTAATIKQVVDDAHEPCLDQITQILRGETWFAVNRRMLANMEIPDFDSTEYRDMVPTWHPGDKRH